MGNQKVPLKSAQRVVPPQPDMGVPLSLTTGGVPPKSDHRVVPL